MALFQDIARTVIGKITGGSHTYVAPLSAYDTNVISTTGAYYSIAYMACELAKMNPVSNLPVAIYTEKDGSPQKVTDHPLTYIITRRWNSFMSAAEGWRWLILRRDTFGNAYVRVKWNHRGEPIAFYPIEQEITHRFSADTGKSYYEIPGNDDFNDAGIYEDYEILCFKTAVPAAYGTKGLSLANLAADNIGLSIDLEKFYSRLLHGGNHFPGFLETDDSLRLDEKKEIAAQLSASSGVVGAGEIRIFDKGLKYKQNPLTMGDIDLVEQQTWVLQQCCRILRVPPSEVYENSRSTYTNVEIMRMQFAATTLTDEASAIEDGLQPILDAMQKRFPQCYVKFNLNGYMRGNYRDRMEGYRIGIYAGFFTRNEVRSWEELPQLEGLDEPLQPVNYYSVDESGEAKNPSLEPVVADMEARIKKRAAEAGKEKAREFAYVVLAPLEQAYIRAGMPFDIETEIERILDDA